MPNFELLEQIQKLRSENKTLSLSISNRKINEELLLEIHDLYVNGYLHLPEFHETFGYPSHKSIVRLFRNRGLKVLNRAKVEELYSKEIHNKIKKTSLERYGVENAMQSPEIQERLKRSNLERYGVENPTQCLEIRKKIESNNLKKFGYLYPASSPEIRKKIEQTNLEKYGHEYPVGCSEIRKKIEQTNLEKYGSVSPFGSKEIWDKVIQTNLERYGSVSAFGCSEIRKKIEQTNLERYHHVNPFGSKEIQEKIKSSNIQRYHQDKHLRCRSEGIQLLSFTEDQILDRLEIIESMILHKLGLTPYRVSTVTVPYLEMPKFRSLQQLKVTRKFMEMSRFWVPPRLLMRKLVEIP